MSRIGHKREGRRKPLKWSHMNSEASEFYEVWLSLNSSLHTNATLVHLYIAVNLLLLSLLFGMAPHSKIFISISSTRAPLSLVPPCLWDVGINFHVDMSLHFILSSHPLIVIHHGMKENRNANFNHVSMQTVSPSSVAHSLQTHHCTESFLYQS